MKSEMNYALITGASRGLGREFALELADRGKNLILVSLPDPELKTLSETIRSNNNIDVICFETDLTEKQNVVALTESVNKNYNVDILINNAGIGGSRKFTEADLNYIDTIIQLNVTAPSLLIHQLMPNLLKRNKAYILNVSSMAAFTPTGYKTVYPASKAFLHSLSRSLYEEFKNTGVFVSVINPGAMKTSAEITKRIEKQGLWGKLTLLDPAKVARFSIRQLFKNDSVIMVNPISWAVLRILPVWIVLPLLTRTIRRELES